MPTPSEDADERGASAPSSSRQLVTPSSFASTYDSWSKDISRCIEPLGSWAIVGVKRRGAVLARRLHHDLAAEGGQLAYGEGDISLYRDDYHLNSTTPQVLGTEIPFGVDGKSILLVDDVLYTGRTVRAALNVLLDFGRPQRIWLAVFVDRGHRELPIAPNFTGTTQQTAFDDRVQLRLVDLGDESDSVDLEPTAPARLEGEERS